MTTTEPNNTTAAPASAPLNTLLLPKDLRNAFLAALATEDANVMIAVFHAAGLSFSTFVDSEVSAELKAEMPTIAGQPPLRIISVEGLHPFNSPNVLIAVPADMFTVGQAAELVFELLTSGTPYTEGSVVAVISERGETLDLLALLDREAPEDATLVFGFDVGVPITKLQSASIH
jgi:hypothetical protein